MIIFDKLFCHGPKNILCQFELNCINMKGLRVIFLTLEQAPFNIGSYGVVVHDDE